MNDTDDIKKTDPEVVDAEIVDKNDIKASSNAPVDVIINVENLIKSHLSQIDLLKVEMKKNREMMEDVLNNDTVYKDHNEKAKEANKLKSKTKGQIMQQPNMMALSVKVKDTRIQIKELEKALSEYLREFQRLTGANEIEGEDGEVREIVYTAKLVKRSSKYK